MREEIIQTLQANIFALNKDDQTYEARKEYLKIRWMRSLMLLIHLKKAKKGEKENFRTLIKKITIALDPRKTKILVEFNNKE